MPSSAEITRNANSNLAFALKILPHHQRRDMQTFYAFCRTVDDLADDDAAPLDQRANALRRWKRGLAEGFDDPDELQLELDALRRRTEIPRQLLIDIVDGCLMDLEVSRYKTWEDLEDYIWKVACTVGLVSIRLFGCHAPESENYAIALAKALQLTNIMRDVGEDFTQRNRIYLPLQDLHQFGYSENDLANKVHNRAFLDLMEFQATRTENWYGEAILSLTSYDSSALRPARIMHDIYHDLLRNMRRDGFRVFDKRYSVSRHRKLLIFIKHFMA